MITKKKSNTAPVTKSSLGGVTGNKNREFNFPNLKDTAFISSLSDIGTVRYSIPIKSSQSIYDPLPWDGELWVAAKNIATSPQPYVYIKDRTNYTATQAISLQGAAHNVRFRLPKGHTYQITYTSSVEILSIYFYPTIGSITGPV